MLIYLVDDDPGNCDMYPQLWDSHDTRTFDSLFDAVGEKAPDLLIIDISAVCPLGDISHSAYSPICSYIDRFPHVPVHITSFVSSNSRQDVVDDVMQAMPDAIVTHGTLDRAEIRIKQLVA